MNLFLRFIKLYESKYCYCHAHYDKFSLFQLCVKVNYFSKLIIFRLAQATGMDKYNAFPYVRAALIGQATQSRNPGNRVTRRGSACSQLYKDCPTDSNSLLNYFNNHNGGLVNNVQPSVDSEVAPLIQAIIGNFFPNMYLN